MLLRLLILFTLTRHDDAAIQAPPLRAAAITLTLRRCHAAMPPPCLPLRLAL